MKIVLIFTIIYIRRIFAMKAQIEKTFSLYGQCDFSSFGKGDVGSPIVSVASDRKHIRRTQKLEHAYLTLNQSRFIESESRRRV